MRSTLKERESFAFGDSLSEIPFTPTTEEQKKQAMFGDMDPDKIVDAFEEQLGIRKPPAAVPNIKYKNIMLSPGTDEDDKATFDKLLNDPELFQVVERSGYWTPRGEYKIFIIYTENLDVRKLREKKKEKEQHEAQQENLREGGSSH